MKAARLEEGKLLIRDEPTPEPGVDHALVRMTATGVCHSDLHIRNGDWAGVGPSIRLGHEGIGVVEALGPGAERFVSAGDRVILGLGGTGGGYWCGACEYCLSGHPRHCSQAKGVMGLFAEEFSAYAPGLVKIPDSLSDEEAPLACGGLTAYGAVKKLMDHKVRPGRWVAVIGAAGGLGHYAVQLAQTFGYRVVGIDVGEERLEFVRSLGAEVALNADKAIDVVSSPRRGPASSSPSNSCAHAGCSWRSVPRRRARARCSSTRLSCSSATPRSSTRRSAPCRTCGSSSISPPPAR